MSRRRTSVGDRAKEGAVGIDINIDRSIACSAPVSCWVSDAATRRKARSPVEDDGFYGSKVSPDGIIHCGPTVPGDAIEVPNPVVVVEASSPSTVRIDAFHKHAGFIQVPSVQHYLMIEPDGGPIIHHRRQDDGTILTRIITGGEIQFDPPEISITATELVD